MICSQTSGATACTSGPVALFITQQTQNLNANNAPLFWLAREAGFHAFVVAWDELEPDDLQRPICGSRQLQTRVCGGFEALAGGGRRPICTRGERINPKIIFHRLRMEPVLEYLYDKLATTHPGALLSFHPQLKVIGTKWGAELCFRAGRELGIHVARPETFLIPKHEMSSKLREIGIQHPLIFKPGEESQGRGIILSDPDRFEAALEEVMASAAPRFVAQKLVTDSIRLDGRKFDLRFYALVHSFRPLRYDVYRDGMARLAAQGKELSLPLDPLSTLTNCSYRQLHAAQVENLTIPQLLNALRAQGENVGNFWERIHDLAGRVFECFASWKPLVESPNLDRLFLVTGMDVMLRKTTEGIQPVLLETNYTPMLHNFGPPAVDEGLRIANLLWLEELFRMCTDPARRLSCDLDGARSNPRKLAAVPPEDLEAGGPGKITRSQRDWGETWRGAPERLGPQIRFPEEGLRSAFSQAADALGGITQRQEREFLLREAGAVLNLSEGRRRLAEIVGNSLPEGGVATVRLTDDGLSGVELQIHRDNGAAVVDFVFEANAEFRSLRHPLCVLFPVLGDNHVTVETKPWLGARFEHLNPNLVGPIVKGQPLHGENFLLNYLGRVITTEAIRDPLGKRYVEPGVGRSALVDFVRLHGKPDLQDFSVLGLGLTPYSEEGFAMTGPVDGLCSLRKAVYRIRNEQRLEEIGCRVPTTAAIISLPGLEKRMADGTVTPAAILVRGFRTILRLQQLDPHAGFLMSDRHRPIVVDYLLGPQRLGANQQPNRSPQAGLSDGSAIRLSVCVRHIVWDKLEGGAERLPESDGDRDLRMTRLRDLYPYSANLLKIAQMRVSRELGRDHETELFTMGEYVLWFAERMGEQLALMRKVRFLHDYRAARCIARNGQSLQETNLSLMGEIVDLDTGVFVDRYEAAAAAGASLSREEFEILQHGYNDFHVRDVEETRAMVQALALVAFRGDTTKATGAAQHFYRVYERNSRSDLSIQMLDPYRIREDFKAERAAGILEKPLLDEGAPLEAPIVPPGEAAARTAELSSATVAVSVGRIR